MRPSGAAMRTQDAVRRALRRGTGRARDPVQAQHGEVVGMPVRVRRASAGDALVKRVPGPAA